MIEALGRWLITTFMTYVSLARLIVRAGGDFVASQLHRRRPVSRVFLKQIYFTGFEALKIVAVIALVLGTVIISQIIALAGTGNESLIGKVMIWLVIRELGPLLTAVIVIARSGTAIATELGAMRINGEIDSIESLGIDAGQYLIMPRVFGVTVAVVLLTVYFELISILGGFAIASLGWHIPFERLSEGVFASLTMGELLVSALKSFFFGLFLSAACCHQGLSVGRSATQIPQAGTKGVMQSLFLVFLVDGVVTLASQLAAAIGNG